MTAFWQTILVRCGIAALCGAAYTSLAVSRAWFSDVPEGLSAHLWDIAGAGVLAGVAAAMVYGLEHGLTPDLSGTTQDEAGLERDPRTHAEERETKAVVDPQLRGPIP